MKEDYKKATGREYVPPSSTAPSDKKSKKENMAPVPVSTPTTAATAVVSPEVEALVKNITEQGDKIRTMKSAKATKVNESKQF